MGTTSVMERRTVGKSADIRDLSFCLIVPSGLRWEIFPWGAYCLQSYLRAHEPAIQTNVIDLRGEDFARDLTRRYGPDVARVLENLKFDQPIIIGQSAEGALGVVAGLGDRLIPIAREAGLFRSWLAARRVTPNSTAVISKLSDEVEAYFLSRIREQLEQSAGRPMVWGLSVYDSSIMSVLLCARAIRKLDKDSPIILGGGYFNATLAKKFVEGIDPGLVNGVVVGRGENVILQLLRACRNGIPVEENRIAGLFTKHNPGGEGVGAANGIAEFVPSDDLNLTDWMPENPMVQGDVVHAMPQIGCSWGKCTFCDHVDREQPAFEVLRDDFFPQLTRTIAPSAGVAPGLVCLDGDEIDPQTFARIVNHIAQTNPSPDRMKVSSWLQIKKFTEELGRTFFACRDRIEAYVFCNVESFNFDALRVMKKGHSPLQGIYVVKSVIDTGHMAHTNIFSYYPGEGVKGVAEEVELVGRIYHLLCSPSSDVDVRTYAANEIDEVFENQEKFHIRIRRRDGDVWLKKAFNVDLPLQHFSALSEENRPFGRESIVVGSYARAIEAVIVPLRRHRLLQRLDLGRGRVRDVLRRLDPMEILYAAMAVARVLALYLVTRFAGRDYWRRGRMWLRIKNRARGFSNRRYGKPPSFDLRGRVLVKDFRELGDKGQWQYELSDDELAVLRYLYKVRKKRGLLDRFRDSIGDAEMEKILRHHKELGSVVESHGSVLCVVNDPGYWEYEPGHWD